MDATSMYTWSKNLSELNHYVLTWPTSYEPQTDLEATLY